MHECTFIRLETRSPAGETFPDSAALSALTAKGWRVVTVIAITAPEGYSGDWREFWLERKIEEPRTDGAERFTVGRSDWQQALKTGPGPVDVRARERDETIATTRKQEIQVTPAMISAGHKAASLPAGFVLVDHELTAIYRAMRAAAAT